jgi:hypothetical protein
MPARATSDIEVAQRGMILAGINPMDTWEDPDPQTQTVKAFYEDLVTAELANHDWKFCTADEVLQRLLETPLFGYDAAYQMPTLVQCIHVKALRVNGTPTVWRVSQDKLYVNASDIDEVQLTGQFRQPVNIWPPYFTLYVETRLAAWASAAITRNGSLSEIWNGMAEGLLLKARSRDAMQQTSDRLPIGRYRAVRRGGRTG